MQNKTKLLKSLFSFTCLMLLAERSHAQLSPPLITSQPQGITAVAGTNVTFTVGVQISI
jgi:hypothetical protein